MNLKKVILLLDEHGNVTTKSGFCVGNAQSQIFEIEEAQAQGKSNVDDVIKLRNAGFDCDEIMRILSK